MGHCSLQEQGEAASSSARMFSKEMMPELHNSVEVSK
jgi:hypothetical protein